MNPRDVFSTNFPVVPITRKVTLVGVGTIVVGLMAYVTQAPGSPTVLAPCNLAVLVPIFLGYEVFGSKSWLLGLGWLPIFFCAWCSFFFIPRKPYLPTRSRALLWCCLALSAVLLVFGWRYGVTFQTWSYVVGVSLVSTAWWAVLVRLLVWTMRDPTFYRSLVFHVSLFAWLAWYAFPYQGELP